MEIKTIFSDLSFAVANIKVPNQLIKNKDKIDFKCVFRNPQLPDTCSKAFLKIMGGII